MIILFNYFLRTELAHFVYFMAKLWENILSKESKIIQKVKKLGLICFKNINGHRILVVSGPHI